MASELNSSPSNPDKKWNALFAVVIILGITAFGFAVMRSIMFANMGYKSGLSDFGSMPRRLGAIMFIAKYSVYFIAVIFAAWAANKLRHNQLVSGNVFQTVCFTMIALLIINHGVSLFQTAEYASNISDYKYNAISLAWDISDIAILTFMAADFKRNFVRPPHANLRSDVNYASAGKGVFMTLLILGITAFLFNIIVQIHLGFSEEAALSTARILSMLMQVVAACASAFIIIWGLISIKTPTPNFRMQLSHAALALSISTISILLIIHVVDIMSHIDDIRERYFGEYRQWITVVSGVINTLITSIILLIAWTSLSRDPAQDAAAKDRDTKIDPFAKYKMPPNS